ncbi:MAG TPA: hypothetical protein VE913_24045 [Longimicrobium sp.]|nr:hypothetical protein [Longimicrobium sp.]
MTDRDAKIDYLEQHIPELASAAVTQAYWASLAAGNHVLVIEDGAIYQISPDGTRTFVKDTEPSTPVAIGATRMLR